MILAAGIIIFCMVMLLGQGAHDATIEAETGSGGASCMGAFVILVVCVAGIAALTGLALMGGG